MLFNFQLQEDLTLMRTLTVKGPNLLNISFMFAVSSQVNLNWYCFVCRQVSGVDTTGISEETCQTEDDIEKGVVSQGENQIVDNVVNKMFDLDAANPIKDSVHSKRFLYSFQELHFSYINICVKTMGIQVYLIFVLILFFVSDCFVYQVWCSRNWTNGKFAWDGWYPRN